MRLKLLAEVKEHDGRRDMPRSTNAGGAFLSKTAQDTSEDSGLSSQPSPGISTPDLDENEAPEPSTQVTLTC